MPSTDNSKRSRVRREGQHTQRSRQARQRAASHTVGAALDAKLGYDVAGLVGGFVGGVVGGIAGPKLTKATVQAFPNAVDNGAFSSLKPAQQNAL